MKKISQDKFINRCIQAHGNKYDYSETVYKNKRTSVIVKCNIHGVFKILPENHTKRNQGCPKCGTILSSYKKTKNTKWFIDRSIKTHGYRYDYSKSKYTKSRNKVIIICKKHGEFTQTANRHIYGRGCPKCGRESAVVNRPKNIKHKPKGYQIYPRCKVSLLEFKRKSKFNEWKQKCSNKFKNKFDYSDVEYKTTNDKVNIICNEHGEFKMTPYSHYKSMYGCPKCSYENKGRGIKWLKNATKDGTCVVYLMKFKSNKDEFIKFGITTYNTNKRYSDSIYSHLTKKVLFSKSVDYKLAYKLEKEIKNKFKKHKHIPEFYFPGKTECLEVSIEEQVLKYIQYGSEKKEKKHTM